MPWFWGRKSKHDEEESEDEESYDSEEYTDEEDDEDEEEEDEYEEVENEDEHSNSNEQVAGGKEKDAEGKAKTLDSPGHETTAATVITPKKDAATPLETSTEEQPSEAAAAAAASLQDTCQSNGQESTKAAIATSTTDDSEHDPNEYQLELKPPAGLPSSQHSHSTDDDDVSLIHSEGLHSGDESYLDTTDDDDDEDDEEEDEPEEEKHKDSTSKDAKINGVHKDSPVLNSSLQRDDDHRKTSTVQVETVSTDDDDSDDDDDDKDHAHPEDEDDEDDEEEEEAPTSFWEKQSLMALAAEHDRVDILKGILADDDQSATNELMDSGLPPLHIAISFGSVNATQSLLRMGADPSIRPNIVEIKNQAQEAPEGSKLEIPNMGRFDGITAWELAFGNAAYEEHHRNQRPSWSMFHGSSSNLSLTSSTRTDGVDRIIKPVDMPPSKREGIRHAFTAEALRCIGADEVDRLKQLLNSGMPASIEVGGKDLYDWSVQLGGLQCEEFLRPIEFPKPDDEHEDATTTISTTATDSPLSSDTATTTPTKKATTVPDVPPPSVGKVLDRPGDEMTVPLLINRLDELESLATALSTCLDNLAEEVSVCHGLLLLGGGASALAAHVKSLKTLQEQKRNLLFQAQQELDHTEQELLDLVRSSGHIGEEVIALTPTIFIRPEYNRAESFRNTNDNNSSNEEENDSFQRQQLLAQIAASENKILKLRASITDLSEENAKEMEQVERRGLTGGINLVRTLREELRDLDYQCSETKNRLATCRAQIGMIHSRLPKQELKPTNASPIDNDTINVNPAVHDEGIVLVDSNSSTAIQSNGQKDDDVSTMRGNKAPPTIDTQTNARIKESELPTTSHPPTTTSTTTTTTTTAKSANPNMKLEPSKLTLDRPTQAIPGLVKRKDNTPRGMTTATMTSNDATKTDSERIANGESRALILRPSGDRGFFTVDLWQVILRIIGLDDAANRRGARISQKQKGTTANLMIV